MAVRLAATVLLVCFALGINAASFALSQKENELECTLDSFFLKVKTSTCSCQCNGQTVEPTASSIAAATNLPVTIVPTFSPIAATTSRPTAIPASCALSPPSTVRPLDEDDFDRVDCFPEPGATQWACEQRGCVWKPSTRPNGESTGAPWCFRPVSSGTFTSTGCSVTDNVASFKLRRAPGQQRYSQPWKDVTFAVENAGNKVLRLKVFDAAESRYEVPVPINKPKDGASNPEYRVEVRNEPYFYIRVIRSSTGAVLFDTSSAGLILEDQYLQLRTQLATNRAYGFGENRRRTFKHTEAEGPIPMWTKDAPTTWDNSHHYGFFPYYVVVEEDGKAHGVLLRTSNGMEYTFGRDRQLNIKTMGGIFDIYILLGDNAEDVTELYTGIVGRPFMPPYWSLGFQLSRWGYYNIGKLRQIIDRNRAAGVPQDVQTLDIDHMRHRQNFIFDWETFAGLDKYIDELKADGIRTVIILDPPVHVDADIKHPRDPPYLPYTRGLEQDVYIKWPTGTTVPNAINLGPNGVLFGKLWPDGRAAYPDFFTDRARTWWIDEIKRTYQTLHFDGLWIDMNEPANFGANQHGQQQWFCGGDLPGNHTCMGLTCPQSRFENPPWKGRIGGKLSDNTICMDFEQECRPGQKCLHYDVHNLYGWSQSEPTLEAARLSTGKRSMVISRSTYPGVGQYVGHWLGDNTADWSDLRWSIIGMMEFNLFGIPYIGADICGFFNSPSEELCARWQQLGAFYPYSRNHNGNNFPDQDPAQWPLVAEVTKDALAIRYRLLPYLYTLFHHAHVRGSTVVRPLHHEFANEQVTYDINDQFLWGSGLMIAPVVHQGADSRRVYFPDAQWYEYSGAKLPHRLVSVTVPMNIRQVGVYLRGGVIFPAQKPALNTAASRRNPFEFIVAVDPGTGSARGNVFWDDGESIDSLQRGAYIYGETSLTTSSDYAEFTLDVKHAGSFTDDDVVVREIHIYGLPFTARRTTLIGGDQRGSATVKLANGITILHLSSPLKSGVKIGISG